MTLPITWSVTADFDKNGSFETDLTSYVAKPGSGLSISRGVGPDGKQVVSQVSLTLKNTTGIFTPENSASSLYGKMRPGIPIQISATYSATPYVLWTGYIQRYTQTFGSNTVPTATLICYDIAKYLGDFKPLNVTASTSRTSSTAAVAVLTAMALTSGDYNFDSAIQNLPLHFAINTDGMSAFMDCVRSEMGGFGWVQADGKLRFENRHSRLGISVDDTWGDGTTIFPMSSSYELSDNELVTNVTTIPSVFASGQADTLVWQDARGASTADSPAMAAGAIESFIVEYGGPVVALTTPVATTDYKANSAIDGTGTDQTASLTVTATDLGGAAQFTITNTSGSTVYRTLLQLRAQPAPFVSQSPKFSAAKSWPGILTDQGAEIRLPFVDDQQLAQDYAMQLVRTFRWPYPKITLNFIAGKSASITSLLGAELGDQILYKDTGIGVSVAANQHAGMSVNDWWYIDSLKYTIPPDWAGAAFQCSVGLVPAYIFRNLDHIAYDLFQRADASSGLGKSTRNDTWADSTGFDITSNTARANTNTASIPSFDLTVTDMDVEVSLSNIGADANSLTGVNYRKQDTSNYLAAYVDKATSKVRLDKVVATVTTNLVNVAWTPTGTAEIRVIVQGNRHRVWVDGVLYIDTTDTTFNTKTLAGLYAKNASGTVLFDDFYGQAI